MPNHISRRAKPYRAPTWSWASIDFVESWPCSLSVTYNSVKHFYSKDVDKHFHVLGWKCSVVGVNPYGRVCDGNLLLKGRALLSKLCYDGKRETESNHGKEKGRSKYDWHLETPVNFPSCDFDIREEGDCHIPEGETIVVLLIAAKLNNAHAIVLAPSKMKANKYQRIGKVVMDPKPFEIAKPAVFDII